MLFKKLKKLLKDRKAIELDMLGWWIIAIIVLVIIIAAIIILRGKGAGAINYIRDLFRFRG